MLQAVVHQASLIYDRIPLRDYIDEETRAGLSRLLFLELNSICNAADPVVDCRERLTAMMLRFAPYQVLLIPPAPEQDPSGLRGQPGISGELAAQLLVAVQKNDEVRNEVYEATASRSLEAVTATVRRFYWQHYWYLEAFNAARLGLHDVAKDGDWFKAFMHAACASQEHKLRWEMEIPTAFDDEVAGRAAAAYSLFADIVLSGEENPQAAWHDYHRQVELPTPSSDYLAASDAVVTDL